MSLSKDEKNTLILSAIYYYEQFLLDKIEIEKDDDYKVILKDDYINLELVRKSIIKEMGL